MVKYLVLVRPTGLPSEQIGGYRPGSRRGRTFSDLLPRKERYTEMAKTKGGKKKKKVETVFLVCEETGDYNYTLRRKSGGEKLKLKKYSPRLRRHTVHVEKKK
jgi:large subunit ribosomal protein L33